MNKRILFIVPYPTGKAASQRFRFEQYFEILKEKGYQFEISAFLGNSDWEILYHQGNIFPKLLALLKGLIKRTIDLFRVPFFDYVFIHRESAPVGMPVFAFIVSKVLRKKIIFDFDDAIWIPNYSSANKFMLYLKRYSNAANLCRWAYKVSAGNHFLVNYARTFNESVVFNPTTIDTECMHNRIKEHAESGEFVIGWTGSHSTMKYLEPLIPVLRDLESKHSFTFMVISDQDPGFDLESFRFTAWKPETEIEDLLKFDVGLMPLPDDPWANGKCGFKALQYNALGIPALVSPVGVNTEIIQDYVNGFICENTQDWWKYLTLLLNNRKLLSDLALHARPLVERNFSVRSNKSNFLSLFS